MNCIFLQKGSRRKGELDLWARAGYVCQTFYGEENCASAQPHENLSPFYALCHSSEEQIRRKAFIRMLQRVDLSNDDFVILGECGAVPCTSANVLEDILRRAFQEHPEADVFRLYHSYSQYDEGVNDVHFESFKSHYSSSPGVPYTEGACLIVVPSRCRQKVVGGLESCEYPVEIALEAAHYARDLHMVVPTCNLYYQSSLLVHEEVIVPHIWRKRRMALCISSYKRPEDLLRQIYSMLDQTYDHFHIFVAVKGVPDFFIRSFLLPYFQHHIDAGRLTVRSYPNSNQFTNFLDSIRGIHLQDYDLFLKIDDDDFYSRDYLATINDFYTYLPDTHSCFYCGNSWALRRSRGMIVPGLQYYSCFGAAQVMSRAVVEHLFASEKNPDMIKEAMGSSSIGFSEDNYYLRVMYKYGAANIAPFVFKHKIKHHILVQLSNTSVMRGGTLEGDIRYHADIAEKDAPTESFVYICHPQWADTVRLFGTRATRATNGDGAVIIGYDGKRLSLKWDRWGEESFILDEFGIFNYSVRYGD